jgi:hypothetical protein
MRGAALLTAVVAPLFAAVQPGQATKSTGHEAKRCGVLAKGSADYRIKARKLSCRFARKWSRAYLNSRSSAPGFDCYRAGTNVTFYCANGAKAYWAERLDRNRRKPSWTRCLPLRGLATGRYRVRLTAYDDADKASRPAFARLRI